MLLLVAAGVGVALVPASIAHSYPVPGVRYTSLGEPAVTHAGVAWRRDNSSQTVKTFRAGSREVVLYGRARRLANCEPD